METAYPDLDNLSAISYPIPLEAPKIIATFPLLFYIYFIKYLILLIIYIFFNLHINIKLFKIFINKIFF